MTPEQEKKLDKIHELLAGSLDKKGLVHKVGEIDYDVKNLKIYKSNDEKFKAKVAGGLAVGTPIAVGIWHWLWGKITGQH